MNEDFERGIKRTINFLPPVPVVMEELMRALHDEKIDLNQVGKIISKDPSMTLNVLKVANSALYRIPNKVETIEHAVRMLGMREITSLCIACGALNALRPSLRSPTIDLTSFWRHSVAAGVFARLLSKELNIGLLSNIYLAGLMHDVGKIVLDRFAHDVYKAVVQLTYDENISVLEAEKRVIGESHDTVGAWLMEKWMLPGVYVEVAQYHHAVSEAPESSRVMVALVSFANQLVRLRNFGFGGDTSGVALKSMDAFRVLERLNANIRNIDFVKFVWEFDKADEEIAEVEKIISGL
jgi:putative nucleotidyltransferase with HDIG domain